MNSIPENFHKRMKNMLEDEAEPFFQTYQTKSYQGLRINTLKTSVKEFLRITDFELAPIPWCSVGFYYTEQDRPGKHPYHAAGLYYIQEPSAMSVVEYLDAAPGDTILDLCAAPGGKSTQIAAHMEGQGLLISNEITASRAKALSENIERLGIKHAIVTNESPERLANRFPQFFDRILVDAPCSGEGMFRKLEEACRDWSLGKVEECALIQKDILDSAAEMLKPGGTIVYSTCTFSKEENEERIAFFLQNHPEFQLIEIDHQHGIAPGRPEWGSDRADLSYTARLWPHRLEGEGHFAAKLQKQYEDSFSSSARPSKGPKVDKTSWQLFEAFFQENLTIHKWDGNFILFGEQLYLLPQGAPNIEKLKVLRPGWHLGTIKKGRFEPSHSLALGIHTNDVKQSISFSAKSPEIVRYLKGESLLVDEKYKGWILVCVDGYSLGWGKVSNGQLKNHYPKGLRWV
ncbi:MAG TPA: RsmB/NOP family class I SAM-dependent RNA methyltransferase [Bacillota bacterium]|nr:RsmB/NOP family class I SAM-dependent RNA methyltransferase [Bacillota bacterium]